jgi:hypothetical protein
MALKQSTLPQIPWLRIKTPTPIHALILLLYGTVLTLPATWPGFILGDDVFAHLIWSRHFADQLWAGEVYPRWLFGMNAGLGSPVFQFYGPVPYYFTALFRPLVSHDPEGWRQLGLAAALAVIASGFTAYAWLRRLTGEKAALIGAVLYMSAPYHLAVDLYQRFAFAELWGFVWMPLVMLSVRASMRGGVGALAGLSLSYALLIMTHLPTTLLFSWVPVAYVLWMAEPGDRIGPFVRVTGGMLLGMGLSAIYLVPAMTTQQYVQFDILTSGHFDVTNNFLFSDAYVNSVMGTVSHRAGLITLATAALVLFAMLVGGLKKNCGYARERLFWGAVGTLAVFMMLPPSEPLWRLIPSLQFVQFPVRFNAVLLVACAVLVALAISPVLQRGRKLQAILLLGAAFGLLIPSIAALKDHLFLSREIGPPSLDRLVELFGTDHPGLATRFKATKSSSCEYLLPKWLPQEQLGLSLFEDVLQKQRRAGKNVTQESPQIQFARWQPPHIELAVETDVEARIKLHQYFYPGWVARLDGGSTRLDVRPSSPDGLLELAVPPGTHRVRIVREALPEERAGQIISGAALVGLAVFAFWPRLRRILNLKT